MSPISSSSSSLYQAYDSSSSAAAADAPAAAAAPAEHEDPSTSPAAPADSYAPSHESGSDADADAGHLQGLAGNFGAPAPAARASGDDSTAASGSKPHDSADGVEAASIKKIVPQGRPPGPPPGNSEVATPGPQQPADPAAGSRSPVEEAAPGPKQPAPAAPPAAEPPPPPQAPKEGPPPGPYVKYDVGNGQAVTMLGGTHSNKPDDPANQSLQHELDRYAAETPEDKRACIVEPPGTPPQYKSADEAFRRGGEPAATARVCGDKTIGGEASPEERARYMEEHGATPDQTGAFLGMRGFLRIRPAATTPGSAATGTATPGGSATPASTTPASASSTTPSASAPPAGSAPPDGSAPPAGSATPARSAPPTGSATPAPPPTPQRDYTADQAFDVLRQSAQAAGSQRDALQNIDRLQQQLAEHPEQADTLKPQIAAARQKFVDTGVADINRMAQESLRKPMLVPDGHGGYHQQLDETVPPGSQPAHPEGDQLNNPHQPTEIGRLAALEGDARNRHFAELILKARAEGKSPLFVAGSQHVLDLMPAMEFLGHQVR